jgi:hypothetical protein
MCFRDDPVERLRADGNVRDVLHLSPGRSVMIGREIGDWVLPYVSAMSRRHANKAQRFLIGNQLLRLERM